MEQDRNNSAHGVATDEPASFLNPHRPEGPTPDRPLPSDPPLLSDCLNDELADMLAGTFPPGSRKPRHDGWTAEAIEGFLRDLAANSVVEHAARAVGRSAASAYAFRNRRQGRAFARMWDAVLIHRARARVASELQARAIAGCVSIRKKDGIVVSEYHYHDNRLAMSLLSRLDRLAEREAASEAQLRALSEDLDDYCDVVAAGGDEDAFVAERRPAEPEPQAPEPAEPLREDSDPELTSFARMAGCSDYLDVDPRGIEVRDLDVTASTRWHPDQWVRAYRSGFMVWLMLAREAPGWRDGPGAPLRFLFEREAARAFGELGDESPLANMEPKEIDTSDLDRDAIRDWTDDQLIRAWRSRFLDRLPPEFWDDLAGADEPRGEEE